METAKFRKSSGTWLKGFDAPVKCFIRRIDREINHKGVMEMLLPCGHQRM